MNQTSSDLLFCRNHCKSHFDHLYFNLLCTYSPFGSGLPIFTPNRKICQKKLCYLF
ncbi:unnamed protein product [Tenebrio molitor]|nr:unnamed protein product [Tenebrio molitor]